MKVLINKFNNRYTVVEGDEAVNSKQGLEIRKALRKHASSADKIRNKLNNNCNWGTAADDSDTVVDFGSQASKSVADEKVYNQIDELVKQRHEIGIKLSQALKENGLITADDSPTQTDLP